MNAGVAADFRNMGKTWSMENSEKRVVRALHGIMAGRMGVVGQTIYGTISARVPQITNKDGG